MPRSIRSRLFIHSVLLAVVPLLVVAMVVTWLSFTVHRRQALDLEREVAEQVGNRVLERLENLRGLLALAEKVTDVVDMDSQKRRDVLLDMLLFRERPFESLTLLDLQGQVLAQVSRDPTAEPPAGPWSRNDAFLHPLRENRAYFGPVSWNKSQAQPQMLMALPLHESRTGSVEGVLVARLRLQNILALVAEMEVGSGETVYILDPEALVLAHRDPAMSTGKVRLASALEDGINQNPEGHWVVSAHSTVQLGNLQLAVVAERRLNAALGMALDTLGTVVTLVGLSFFCALGVGYLSIRRVVRPVQELAATARAVRNGVLSSRAPTHGKDELGELAVAFNAMTEQLEQTLSGLQEKVSELTLTQERLKESEQQYRDIYEHASEGIFLVDAEGVIRDANPQALLWLGYTLEELAGSDVGGIVHPDDLAELPVTRVMEIVGEGSILRMERRYRCKSGDYLDVDVSIKLIGESLVQVMFRDVSERKRMEEELVRAKNAAEEANKAKGVFLATMSHEIRTPLSNVIGMAELTLESDLDDDLRDNLEMILDSAVSLIDIINDILDLAKIEARGISLASVDFNLTRTLERTLKTFATQAARKEDTLHLEVAPDVPAVLRGDPGRLAQVVRNLVHNAIKFTENGAITLEVTRPSVGDSPVKLLFAVRDTGIGVPQDKLNQLFFSFTQVDSSYQEKYKGTGLGLAISKKIVELMDGAIWVESEEGRGSTFYFTAIFHKGATEDAGQKPKPAPKPASAAPELTANVLFAEDNAVNQLFIADFLKSMGHRVTTVSNGRAALEALQQAPYDIVLMDIQMPEMDGLEATRHIRSAGPQAPFDPQLPVLALTAYAMSEDRQRFLAAGMDGCITKPVDRDLLQRTLCQLVRDHRTKNEASA